MYLPHYYLHDTFVHLCTNICSKFVYRMIKKMYNTTLVDYKLDINPDGTLNKLIL